MSLQDQFNKAAEDVKALKKTPQDADLLEIYALFKQSTVGDCNTEKPGFLDFKGKAKWESWKKQEGVSKDSAMEKYIAKVAELQGADV